MDAELRPNEMQWTSRARQLAIGSNENAGTRKGRSARSLRRAARGKMYDIFAHVVLAMVIKI
jgi:hypothetical protein